MIINSDIILVAINIIVAVFANLTVAQKTVPMFGHFVMFGL